MERTNRGRIAAGRYSNTSADVQGDILVNGSVQLVRTLAAHDLVDEYRLMVFHTVLGAGKRLFGETAAPAALKLVDARRAGETLIVTYVPAARAS